MVLKRKGTEAATCMVRLFHWDFRELCVCSPLLVAMVVLTGNVKKDEIGSQSSYLNKHDVDGSSSLPVWDPSLYESLLIH